MVIHFASNQFLIYDFL